MLEAALWLGFASRPYWPVANDVRCCSAGRMFIIRLCLGLLALGAAAVFGYSAYFTFAVCFSVPGGTIGSLSLLGVTLPFQIGLDLLIALALAFALLAAYVLFLSRSDN